ncbi:MAG: type II toxin-antitoxin system RelB/DinJ family antitoxin [Propionibacteriaceae bacterium]|nr:type II toxin-antitoxin system RelB/DinJ family antitoxin [Propionibacteriaceae bacterium]
MASVVVRARIDEEVKKEAQVVLSATGMSLSDAIRLLLTRVAVEKRLPFEPLAPNEKTLAAIRESRLAKVQEFHTKEALMDWLDADE